MKYDGYVIGPVIRQIRKDRNMTLEQVSEAIGLSRSSVAQMEQGGRNMSMGTLFLFMDLYKCDANTLLNIKRPDDALGIDYRLNQLSPDKRQYFHNTFTFMLDTATGADA